jgi:lipopolysaccharide/colanic/teichoic acid biosynthesis glycosyltransferase
MKRAFDIVLSIFGLMVLGPLLAVIAAHIVLFDGRPVFFCQERIGYRGKPFRIWKFRTMVRDAERLGAPLTVGRDPRITRLGHWLRKTKLDELPQLWNVLVGEMSFVGPRPEVEQYVRCYTPAQCQVLDLKPGITDAASIAYRDESELLEGFENPEQAYVERIIPAKIRLNLEYARRANVLRDCVIIVRTLGRLCWRH